MNKIDLQWIAGIIDAEGSIEISLIETKRKYCSIMIRRHRIRISTTDNIIIPHIAKLLKRRYNDSPYRKSIAVSSNECKELLIKLIPFLYLKQPQAKFLIQAMNIKKGSNTPYSKSESILWDKLHQKVCSLNTRGNKAPPDEYNREHKFSWSWLAGLIDGDGTITNTEFGPRSCPTIKPVIKISLTNLKTIKYLSEKLGIKSLPSGGGKGNKRITRAIRLMSNNIYIIAPKIIPFLTLKKRRVELALEIVKLRREIPNGQYDHPNVQKVKNLLQQIDKANIR